MAIGLFALNSIGNQDISLIFILNSLIGNETKNAIFFDFSINYGLKYPVIISDSDFKMNLDPFWEKKPEVYIVNSTSYNLEVILKKFGSSFNYNPKSKLILLDQNKALGYYELLSSFFINSADIITIKQCARDSEETTVREYSYTKFFTYEQGELELSSKSSFYLQIWKKKNFTICFLDESVPPYSLYTVCKNCTPNSGLGFDVADMVLNKLNITRLERMLPGSDLSSESLKDWLISGDCDMILSPSIIDDGLLDFIFPINDDELIWFVPSPSEVPKWKYLTRVFSLKIWLIWLLTILVTVTVWFIGKNADLSGSFGLTNGTWKKFCIFSIQKSVLTIMFFLEQGTVPKVIFFSHTLFMLTVIMATQAFNMMYKTGFTSLLLGSEFLEDDIKSLEDIVDQGLYVSFAEWRLSAFEGTSSKVKDYFKDHNTECETISSCVQRMESSKDLALLMSIENYRYDFLNFLDDDGRRVIVPIYPRFVKPLYGSILLRGNPMIEIMNHFNIILRDHGFIDYILSKYDKKFVVMVEREDEQLSIENLKGPFFILVFGLFISIITFVVELIIAFLKSVRICIDDSSQC